MLYVLTSGLSSPERIYASFILAADAIATGMRATVYFFLKGVEPAKRGESEKIKMEGYPPLKQVMERAINEGVELEACEQSCMLAGLRPTDLIDNVKMVGPSTLNDRVLEADAVMYF